MKDTEVTVEVEGTEVEAFKEYDEALGCLKISVPETSATSEIIITLGAPVLRENDVKPRYSPFSTRLKSHTWRK